MSNWSRSCVTRKRERETGPAGVLGLVGQGGPRQRLYHRRLTPRRAHSVVSARRHPLGVVVNDLQQTSQLALLAANEQQVRVPLGRLAVQSRGAALPSTDAGDHLVAMLVLVNDVLEFGRDQRRLARNHQRGLLSDWLRPGTRDADTLGRGAG